MKARILRPEEWGRLEPHMPPLVPYVRPDDMAVVVVEDDAGKIVACMSVLRATHFEGAWIDAEHRNAGVTRALMRLAIEVAKAHDSVWVFAGSSDDHMTSILGRLGGKRVMDAYVLSVGGEECRPQ